MLVAIADTHTAIWYLFSDPRLGERASGVIEAAVRDGDQIGVSAISLAEIVYLMEKSRVPSVTLSELRAATADPAAVLRIVAFDESVAARMPQISRAQVPELPDRIIAATASFYNVPVLSRDHKIRASGLETIW